MLMAGSFAVEFVVVVAHQRVLLMVARAAAGVAVAMTAVAAAALVSAVAACTVIDHYVVGNSRQNVRVHIA